ncbi:MAG: response regulator [Rhizomicrobium sp.]
MPPTDSIRHVLVVEDEPLIRWCAAEMIEEAGYAIVEAENADAALRILEARDDIDCIFTDVDMPGSMNGLALARTAHDRWPPIKIIVTSGKRMLSRDQLPQGGRFLAKPYRASDILGALAKFAPWGALAA